MNTEALKHFKGEYNCAQSILGSFAAKYKLPVNMAFSLANGFGAGIAYHGKTCGALIGTYMLIGLEGSKIHSDVNEAKEWSKNQIQAFNRALLANFPSTECRELTGFDVSNEAELKKAYDAGVFDNICPKIIEFSSTYFEKLRSK